MDEDEDDFQEHEDDNIHYVGDDTGKYYLTRHDYQEALMTEQIDENYVDNGIFQMEEKKKYNLRSTSNTAQQSAPAPTKNIATPVKKKIRYQRISRQPIQTRIHQLLQRRLLLLPSNKFKKIRPLTTNKVF
jgi:hypothetical protein